MSTLPKIKKIAVAGAGGIGSHLTSMLFDFGVNRNQFPFAEMQIDVYDDDAVEVKNLLHQNFSESDINTLKVKSLEDRYAITPIPRFMTEKDFGNYDLIFSAVDSMEFRKALYDWTWANPGKAFWIDGRCESRTGMVLNKSLPKDLLQKFIDDSKERAGCLLAFEKANDISHALPIIVASTMIQVYLNYLRGVTALPEKIFMV